MFVVCVFVIKNELNALWLEVLTMRKHLSNTMTNLYKTQGAKQTGETKQDNNNNNNNNNNKDNADKFDSDVSKWVVSKCTDMQHST